MAWDQIEKLVVVCGCNYIHVRVESWEHLSRYAETKKPSPFCWSGKKFVEKRSCSSDQETETRSLKPQLEAHKKANAKRVRGEVAERVRCLPKRSGEQGIMTLALTDHLKHTLLAERFYSIPAAAHATMTRIRSNLCCGSLN